MSKKKVIQYIPSQDIVTQYLAFLNKVVGENYGNFWGIMGITLSQLEGEKLEKEAKKLYFQNRARPTRFFDFELPYITVDSKTELADIHINELDELVKNTNGMGGPAEEIEFIHDLSDHDKEELEYFNNEYEVRELTSWTKFLELMYINIYFHTEIFLEIAIIYDLKTMYSDFFERDSNIEKGPNGEYFKIDEQHYFNRIFVSGQGSKYLIPLQNTIPPLISENHEFIGNPNQHKGVVCSYFKELQLKGIIKPKVNRQELASVLNKQISGLDIGKDGKTFDNMSKTYDKKFKRDLMDRVAAISKK